MPGRRSAKSFGKHRQGTKDKDLVIPAKRRASRQRKSESNSRFCGIDDKCLVPRVAPVNPQDTRSAGVQGNSELDLGAEQHGASADTRNEVRRIGAKGRVVHAGFRILEITMVPHVDQAEAELQPQALGERNVFGSAKIPICQCGASESVTAQVAATRHGVRQWQSTRRQRRDHDSGAVDGRREGAQISFNHIVRECSSSIVIGSKGSCGATAAAVDACTDGKRLPGLILNES